MSLAAPPISKPANLVSEIRSLTGLRGIAAIWVVLYHYLLPPTPNGAASRFLTHGYLAVDLFFALSGFVMALNYSSMFVHGAKWKSFRLFLGRRFARIYPLYLFMLLLCAVLSGIDSFFHSQFWANLLLIQNWGYWLSFDNPSWSISTEWFAYLLFPWIVPLTLFQGRRAAGCTLLLCLTSIAALGISYSRSSGSAGPLDIWHGPWSLVRCVAEFTLGMLAYRSTKSSWGRALSQSSWGAYLLSAGTLALLCFQGTDVVVALLWPLLVLSLAGRRNAINRLLGSPPLELLGLLSYSIYLLHYPLFVYLSGRFETTLRRISHGHIHAITAAICVVPLLLISALLYYGLEVPSRRLLRNLLEGAPGRP